MLEVNASPSLSASDKADWVLKTAMLEDMLDIVDVEGKKEPGRPPELKVGGFDLIWDNGPVLRFDRPTSLPTMLGVHNERDKNQLRIYKEGFPDHIGKNPSRKKGAQRQEDVDPF